MGIFFHEDRGRLYSGIGGRGVSSLLPTSPALRQAGVSPGSGLGLSPRGAVRLRAPSPGLTGIPFFVLTFGAGGKRRTADLETPLRLLPQGGLGWGGPAGLRGTDPPARLHSWLGAGGSPRSQPRFGSETPAPATTSSRQRFPASASPQRPHSPPGRAEPLRGPRAADWDSPPHGAASQARNPGVRGAAALPPCSRPALSQPRHGTTCPGKGRSWD